MVETVHLCLNCFWLLPDLVGGFDYFFCLKAFYGNFQAYMKYMILNSRLRVNLVSSINPLSHCVILKHTWNVPFHLLNTCMFIKSMVTVFEHKLISLINISFYHLLSCQCLHFPSCPFPYQFIQIRIQTRSTHYIWVYVLPVPLLIPPLTSLSLL